MTFHTEESALQKKFFETKELLKSVLEFACQEGSCPCAWPRLSYLWSFDHRQFEAGPVICLEAHLLGDLLRGRNAGVKEGKEYFIIDESRSVHKQILRFPDGQIAECWDKECYICPTCGSRYEIRFDQYNANFERYFLICLEDKAAKRGAAMEFPFPVVLGFQAFDARDIKKCLAFFFVTEPAKLENYLTEPA